MPESASFSMRQKPNFRRRRTLAVLVLIVAAVVVVALLSRGGSGGGGTAGGKPIPTLQFVSSIKPVAQSKPPSPSVSSSEGAAIVKMFNDYYQEAFVDPGKWGDGQFSDLRDKFSADAQASFTKDLPSLTIGAARTELTRVDPTPSNLVVTIYFDAQARPTLAVAAATFNAKGTLKQSGPALTIKQKATFYLRKTGSAWTITAYDADQSQVTPTPSPTASPS